MKKILFIITLLLLSTLGYAQTSWKYIENFVGFSMQHVHCTPSGDVIASGTDNGLPALARLGPDGQPLWAKRYPFFNTPNITLFSKSVESGNAIYSIGGTTYTFLLKTDGAGNPIWNRKLGGANMPTDLAATADGGCVIANRIDVSGGGTDVSLMKVSPSGNLDWNQRLSLGNTDEIIDIEVVADGYVCLGSTSGYDFFVAKYDLNGTFLGSRAYHVMMTNGNNLAARAKGISQNATGEFIISGDVGTSIGTLSFPFAMKTNANGQVQWLKGYYSTPKIFTSSQAKVSDGYGQLLYVEQNNGWSLGMLKINDQGAIQWAYTYPNEPFSALGTMDNTPINGFVFHKSWTGGGNQFLYQSDNQGHTGCYESPLSLIPVTLLSSNQSVGQSAFVGQITSSILMGWDSTFFLVDPICSTPIEDCGVKVNFNYTSDNACDYTFQYGALTNPGSSIVSWYWDFGDGSTSSLPNPTHTFPNGIGTYTVCLTVTAYQPATGNRCVARRCKQVTVDCESTERLAETSDLVDWEFAPNPVQDQVHITSTVPIKHIRLFDMVGKTLKQVNFPEGKSTHDLNLDGVPKGIYFLQINGAPAKRIAKI